MQTQLASVNGPLPVVPTVNGESAPCEHDEKIIVKHNSKILHNIQLLTYFLLCRLNLEFDCLFVKFASGD